MSKVPTELFARIRPCDMDKPFAFVSYSHADGEHVWKDILTLQEKGYNIWVDLTVNPTEEKSWDEKTAEVIAAFNCRVVLFYTSKHSVVSAPCMKEILSCESEEAMSTHGRKAVPLTKIDVAPIEDIVQFERDANCYIDEAKLSGEKKSKMANALSTIMKHCFSAGNGTVRVMSRNDPRLEVDYDWKLEDILAKSGLKKSSPEERYRNAFQLMADHSAHRHVLQELEYLAGKYFNPHAALLLYYLYTTGLCGVKDSQKAEAQKSYAYFHFSEDQWIPQALSCIASQTPEKAVPFYLAHGLHFEDAESFLSAAKLLIPKNNPKAYYPFAKDCLDRAAKLGNIQAPKLLNGLKKHLEGMI